MGSANPFCLAWNVARELDPLVITITTVRSNEEACSNSSGDSCGARAVPEPKGLSLLGLGLVSLLAIRSRRRVPVK
jgi:hypothetical protein